MKTAFATLLLLFTISTYGQIDTAFYKDGKVTYWAVNTVDASLKATDLLKNFNAWWADYRSKFNSRITRTQWKITDETVEKDENGIVVKGKMFIQQMLNSSVWSFDLIIQVKDGRYKYTMTNFGSLADENKMALGGVTQPYLSIEDADKKGNIRSLIEKVQAKITDIIYLLETAMSKKRPDDNF